MGQVLQRAIYITRQNVCVVSQSTRSSLSTGVELEATGLFLMFVFFHPQDFFQMQGWIWELKVLEPQQGTPFGVLKWCLFGHFHTLNVDASREMSSFNTLKR